MEAQPSTSSRTADIESVQLTETSPPAQAVAPAAAAAATASSTSTTPAPQHHRHQHPAQPLEQGSWLCCVPCYWLQHNNSVRKASLTIVTLVVTSLLVASPVLFLISGVPAREGDRPRDCHRQEDGGCTRLDSKVHECRTAPCLHTARRLLASMSSRADPCQDFYQFACGGWSNPNPGPEVYDRSSFNSLQSYVDFQIQHMLSLSTSIKPFQKLGTFYDSCLKMRDKRTSTAPMFALLSELGGYLLPGAPEPSDLTPLLTRLLLVNGAPLFDVYLERDLNNRTRLAVFLDLPRRYGHNSRLLHGTFPEFQVLERMFDVLNPEAVQVGRRKRSQAKESRAYTYIKDRSEERRLLSLEKLLQKFLPSNMPMEMRTREAQSILLFASMLSKLFPREKEIMNRARDSYRSYTLEQLQDKFTFVQWKELLEEVFANNFTQTDVLYVAAPDYMDGLQRMLSHFQNRIVHNALLLVYARDILFELVNATTTPNWPAFCTRVSINLFTKAVSALYMKLFSPEYLDELKVQVERMFGVLKSTLGARMKTVSWLDEPTREAALLKLASLRGHFFTWPQLWNQTYVASLLQDVEVDPDDFFNNVIRRYRQLRSTPHQMHDNTPGDQKWAYPFVVNAFYELTINSIVIPLAMLRPPYFQEDVPSYVPYASLGLVFAHEMLHAFDQVGIGYDVNGTPREWVTAETRLRLEARLDCVARQYASTFSRKVHFMGANVDVQFDWNVTRNENMADIGGLQIAYRAWLSLQGIPDPRLPGIALTPRQLFFLNAAQTYCSSLSPEDYILSVEMDFHTPYPERVNGMMMNSPSFAEAFNCPVGSKMNPTRKCSTW